MSYLINKKNDGFTIVATLLFLFAITIFLGSYFIVTKSEMTTLLSSKGTSTGFYSAESGLNIRAESIRQIFTGYGLPTGTPPNATNPCQGSNMGSGDMVCLNYELNGRTVRTYVTPSSLNPITLTISPGEKYQNLSAQEYRYSVNSMTQNTSGDKEAQLELHFKSRLIPVYQFAVFYDKDLEIHPGQPMTLSGPVHSNGNLFLNADTNSLIIYGQVTSAGKLYRGYKRSESPSCRNNINQVYDPLVLKTLFQSCPSNSRYLVKATDVTAWNGMIKPEIEKISIPNISSIDPTPGQIYWDKADLRIVMNVDNNDNLVSIQAKNSNNTVNNSLSTTLNSCTGVAGSSGNKAVGRSVFFSRRENKNISILDIDMRALFSCNSGGSWLGLGKQISDATDGGLVIFATVTGPKSFNMNNPYGVRIRNAEELKANSGTQVIKGINFITDQALYTHGNYNSINKKPSSLISDTITFLSGSWVDTNGSAALTSRTASNIIVNSGIISGTTSTGNGEGDAFIGASPYNGGLENMPRFLESWTSRTVTYRGSLVSFSSPRRTNSIWGASNVYKAPTRDWNYDVSFNNPANLPPLTTRLVYIKQELFVRKFED